MTEFVYVVKGICRHFTGECEIKIVGVRKDEDTAKMLGYTWVCWKNYDFKCEGKNIHASYELERHELI